MTGPILKWTIIAATSTVAAFFLVIVYLNIYNYMKDRRAYIRDEGLKNDNARLIGSISRQMEAIRSSYPQYVHLTIYAKTDYILKIISRRSLEFQNRLLKGLDGMIYETSARLKEDMMDVARITAPLNNIIKILESSSK